MPASAPSSPYPGIALIALLLAWGVLPRGVTGRVGEAMRDDGPALLDVEKQERGYYETLIDVGRRVDRLDQSSSHAQADAPFDAGELAVTVNDLREFVLKPNLAAMHRGQPWSTNARGMRDRSYQLTKPAETLRIALVGDSIGVGWGVDGETGFEPKLEQSLDAASRSTGGPQVEVWNFSVPGHAPGQRWEDFRRFGWSTEPDLLIYEATPADTGWDERRLRGLLARGIGWDAPQYHKTLETLAAPRHGTSETYKRTLRPHRREILAGVYAEIAGDCARHGVPSLWVLVPRVGRPATAADREALGHLGASRGLHRGARPLRSL